MFTRYRHAPIGGSRPQSRRARGQSASSAGNLTMCQSNCSALPRPAPPSAARVSSPSPAPPHWRPGRPPRPWPRPAPAPTPAPTTERGPWPVAPGRCRSPSPGSPQRTSAPPAPARPSSRASRPSSTRTPRSARAMAARAATSTSTCAPRPVVGPRSARSPSTGPPRPGPGPSPWATWTPTGCRCTPRAPTGHRSRPGSWAGREPSTTARAAPSRAAAPVPGRSTTCRSGSRAA